MAGSSFEASDRRLAAVWFADLVGYSRLAAQDEATALRLLRVFQETAREEITRCRGLLVKLIGDAALAEFPSVESAVRAALALQGSFSARSRESGVPSLLRIGVHIGDLVISADGDLYGDGVNIAARLQVEAEPGQVLISEDVWRQLRQRTEYRFEALGERELKGIPARVAVFSVAVNLPATVGSTADPALPAITPEPEAPRADAAEARRGGESRDAGSGRVVSSTWRRWAFGLTAAAVGVSAVLLPFLGEAEWAGGRGSRALAPSAADASQTLTIAVLPFSVHGDPEYTYLGVGMVTLLSTNLNGVGDVRTVDPYALLGHPALPAGAEALPPARASALAGDLGADVYLVGNVVESGGRLRIAASLYRRDAAPTPILTASAEGEAQHLFALVDELSREFLLGQFGAPADRLSQLAVRTTPSLPALKAYLDGERELRAANYEDAAGAFRRAVREDPSFALAHYRLSTAAEWSFRFVEAQVAAERAVRFSEHLSPRDQQLIRAWRSFLIGESHEAERLYNAILEEDPHDVEAWSGMGEVRAHYNAVRGRSVGEAVPAFEKVLALAPAYGEARFHMMEFAAGQGDVARFDSLRSGVNPRARQALSWDAARAFAWGSPAEIEAVTRRIGDADDVIVGIASVRAAAHFRDLPAAQGIASLLTRPDRPTGWRAAGYLILAQAQLAQGGLQAARGALEAALPLEPDWTRELLALGALLPQSNVDEQEVRSIRAELEGWQPGRSTPDLTFFFGVHADAHSQLRLYLLGLLSVRLGEYETAGRYRGELQTAGRTREARMLSTTLATSVAAHLAWRRGEPQRALDLLESARLEPSLERIAISPFFAQALDRYLRGEALRAVGRDQEALRWFASLAEGSDVLFWAPAHQRQSELLARMGRTEEAQWHARAAATLMSSDARGAGPSVR